MAGRPATLKVDIIADAKGMGRGIGETDRQLGRLGGSAGKAGGLLAKGLGLGIAAAGVLAIKVGVDVVKAASDMGETISKVGQLFGPAAKEVEKFADSAATSLGISKQSALDGAATFATFGKSAGKSGQDLAGFSTGLLTAAGDMASFHNASPEETIAAIGSGLRGEAEPLRRFGILLDDATLRNEALKQGLISSTSQALTPQQKVLASQAVILSQVGAASGDFARTSGSLANQQKIAAATVENLKVKLGQGLLPIVTRAATFVNTTVIPAVSKFASQLAANLGPAISRVGAFITGRLVPAAQAFTAWFIGKIVPGIRSYLVPILNGARSAFASVSSSISNNRENLATLGNAIKKIAEFAARYILPIIGKAVGQAFRNMGTSITVVITTVATLVGWIDSAITKVREIGRAIRDSPLGKAGGAIGGLFSTSSATPLVGRDLMGPSRRLAGPAGELAGPGRFAWSPFTTSGGSSMAVGTSGAVVYIDRRSFTARVEGAVSDPVGAARAVERLLRDHATRTGRPTLLPAT